MGWDEGIGVFVGRVVLVAYRIQSMGWGCWSSLPAGNLYAGCQEKLRTTLIKKTI